MLSLVVFPIPFSALSQRPRILPACQAGVTGVLIISVCYTFNSFFLSQVFKDNVSFSDTNNNNKRFTVHIIIKREYGKFYFYRYCHFFQFQFPIPFFEELIPFEGSSLSWKMPFQIQTYVVVVDIVLGSDWWILKVHAIVIVLSRRYHV